MKKIIGVTLAVLLVMTSMCSCSNGDNTTGTDKNGNITDDSGDTNNTKDDTVKDDMKDAADDTINGIENGVNDATDAIDDAVTDDTTNKKDDENK